MSHRENLSRRTLLRRTAAAAVAAGAASGGLLTPEVAHASHKLSDRHKDAFAALVEALGSTPDSIVDPRKADREADRLAERYEDEPRTVRQNIDAILDELDDIRPRGARLRKAPVELRRREVQERLDKPKRRNRQMSQAFLIGQAVALATEPFAPGAFEGEDAL